MRSVNRLSLVLIFTSVGILTWGQDRFSDGFLDSTFQEVTVGGLSSMILDKEGIEVQFNNTLTSFWFRTFEFNAEHFRRMSNQRRITQFNQSVRVQYGFDDNARWDLGLEIKYNWFRDDDFSRNSPFKIFSNDTRGASNFSGLSSLGVRARFQPFYSEPKFIVQGSYSFPVGNHESLEKRMLNADLNQVDLFATYYNAWNEKTYYFLQLNTSGQFSPARTNYLLGGSSFLVLSFWNQLVYVYPGITYAFASQKQKLSSNGFTTRSHFVYGGLGGQYALRNQIILYGFWNIPLVLDNGSLYSEIVRGSFTNVSIGLRLLFP